MLYTANLNQSSQNSHFHCCLYRMEPEEFRRCGTDMVNYIADYMDTIRSRLPFPDVQPGFLREQIPDEAPFHGESWENVKNDLERVVMKGVSF
ncbi:dopamine decarboxylase [Plakobranchus ocellatus]|uniref:Dopamine decarboxylase n=1 Tax=Plakobranchus ocellatus TaxID=259542 RepID=A0AAV4DQP2_9GAST|nr:dopamine decarboxylase [Plakobranchus ocellatus]